MINLGWLSRWAKQGQLFFFKENRIIIWMLLVAIVPMVILCVISYRTSKEILHQQIHTSLRLIMDKKSERIDHFFNERKNDARLLVKLPLIQRVSLNLKPRKTDAFEFKSLAFTLQKKGFSGLRLYRPNGQLIFSNKMAGALLKAVPKQDLLQSIQFSQLILSPYLYKLWSPKTGQLNILIFMPVIVQKRIQAILVLSIPSETILRLLSISVGISHFGEALLLGNADNHPAGALFDIRPDDGTFSSETVQHLFPIEQRFAQKALLGGYGSEMISLSPVHRVWMFYNYLPQINSSLLVEYDDTFALREVVKLKEGIIWFGVISVLLTLLVAVWVATILRRVTRKSERLLRNILPEAVIHEIKMNGRYRSRSLAFSSIIFIDMVGFTEMSVQLPPEILVDFLGVFFDTLDALCGAHQVEKIKTMGDAFMGVVGLESDVNLSKADILNAAVEFSVAVLAATSTIKTPLDKPLAVRIGIHTGPATTGVLGTQKMIFDLWGNTINIASRLESTSRINAIHLSAEAYRLLKNRKRYTITEKQMVLKGLGMQQTYLLVPKDIK